MPVPTTSKGPSKLDKALAKTVHVTGEMARIRRNLNYALASPVRLPRPRSADERLTDRILRAMGEPSGRPAYDKQGPEFW